MLQYFETILPLVESLWSSSQDEVNFMGGGAVGGLWRHQQWSPSWILPRVRYQVKKIARNGNFLCLTWKVTHKKALCMILATRFTFIVERNWTNMYFHSKWLYHLLLMASYFVSIDHHWTWLKMCARDKPEQLLKTSVFPAHTIATTTNTTRRLSAYYKDIL